MPETSAGERTSARVPVPDLVTEVAAAVGFQELVRKQPLRFLPVVGPEDRAGTELGAHWADGEQQREGDESRREQRAAGVASRGPCTRLPLGVFLVRSHAVWR